MKKFLSLIIAFLPFCVCAQENAVNISGAACEIFDSSQPISSVRVRVTDKASFNAVSQIAPLAELRSSLLDHDFNTLIYDLVDNHIQNMNVKTTSQDANELCVQVTGSILTEDIITAITGNSPSGAKKQYDFEKANGIVQEENTPYEKAAPTEAEIMYNGEEDFSKIPEPSSAPIAYQGDDAAENTESAEEPPAPQIKTEDETTSVNALVYIAPVEYPNQTQSAKPISVLKDFFSNEDLYTILNSPDGADYIITPKLLKAKIDPIDQQTKRLQMVVSVELKISHSDGSISDHQNRFVLFKAEENEQEVAMNLLKKLLAKSGEKLIQRIEQNENKWARGPFLRPKPMGDL